jgi:hypothetical protein
MLLLVNTANRIDIMELRLVRQIHFPATRVQDAFIREVFQRARQAYAIVSYSYLLGILVASDTRMMACQ